MINEIMNVIEDTKNKEIYKHIFKENYVTQSTIHVNLRLIENDVLDLYRVFDEFEPNGEIPHIVLNTIEKDKISKSDERTLKMIASEKENHDMLMKWVETTSFGVSFKIKIYDEKSEKKIKYMNVKNFLKVMVLN
jgi:hypothetical protein